MLCTKCNLEYTEDCSICNGHTTVVEETTNQIAIVFDDQNIEPSQE